MGWMVAEQSRGEKSQLASGYSVSLLCFYGSHVWFSSGLVAVRRLNFPGIESTEGTNNDQLRYA